MLLVADNKPALRPNSDPTMLVTMLEKRCSMSWYKVCEMKYGKNTRMSFCILSRTAVWEPTYCYGYIDLQSLHRYDVMTK